MVASNAINLMKLSSSDPKSKKQIQELMDHFDKDHDGRLDAHEILNLHNTLVKKQKQDQNLRNLAFLLFIMLCLSVVANFGTAVASNILTRVTKVYDDRMTDPKDSRYIVSTATYSTNLPLYLVPLAGLHVIDQMTHLQFTALNVTLVDTPMAGFYPDLVFGMEVRSYIYLNETAVLLRGSSDERLFINFGEVTAWGFEGMGDATFSVCPGLADPSSVKCSILRTDDVDLSALRAKARAMGILGA